MLVGLSAEEPVIFYDDVGKQKKSSLLPCTLICPDITYSGYLV
jgi:hypothetical protein